MQMLMTQVLKSEQNYRCRSRFYRDHASISAVGICCIGRPCQVDLAGSQVSRVLHGGEECSCCMLRSSVVAPRCSQPCEWDRKLRELSSGCVSEQFLLT